MVQNYEIPAKTAVPYTYCIGYVANVLKPSFLEALNNSPPDLYHLGFHTPFKFGLGPTYDYELFTDEILPPGEIPREIERIEHCIAEMRKTGVERIIPYVYTMAFFGNPEKRSGFLPLLRQLE